jgi:hypothetical protein
LPGIYQRAGLDGRLKPGGDPVLYLQFLENAYGEDHRCGRNRSQLRGETQGGGSIDNGRSLEKGRHREGTQGACEDQRHQRQDDPPWVNHVDLFRIKGVAGEYAELLEAAGVDTVPELSKRKADNLHAKMVQVNDGKKLVRKVPVLKMIERWISQAKKLPRKVSY